MGEQITEQGLQGVYGVESIIVASFAGNGCPIITGSQFMPAVWEQDELLRSLPLEPPPTEEARTVFQAIVSMRSAIAGQDSDLMWKLALCPAIFSMMSHGYGPKLITSILCLNVSSKTLVNRLNRIGVWMKPGNTLLDRLLHHPGMKVLKQKYESGLSIWSIKNQYKLNISEPTLVTALRRSGAEIRSSHQVRQLRRKGGRVMGIKNQT